MVDLLIDDDNECANGGGDRSGFGSLCGGFISAVFAIDSEEVAASSKVETALSIRIKPVEQACEKWCEHNDNWASVSSLALPIASNHSFQRSSSSGNLRIRKWIETTPHFLNLFGAFLDFSVTSWFDSTRKFINKRRTANNYLNHI